MKLVFKPLPKHLQGKVFNANNVACDMAHGPCACGAWHNGEHVKRQPRARSKGGK